MCTMLFIFKPSSLQAFPISSNNIVFGLLLGSSNTRTLIVLCYLLTIGAASNCLGWLCSVGNLVI